eukprot:gene2502-697_t
MPKQAATHRKKRKRMFYGIQKQDQQSSSLGQGLSTAISPGKPNRSSEKISSNCPVLEKMDSQIMTRKRALHLGKETPTGEVLAYGYKIIDTDCLRQFINNTVICAKCRSSEGAFGTSKKHEATPTSRRKNNCSDESKELEVVFVNENDIEVHCAKKPFLAV